MAAKCFTTVHLPNYFRTIHRNILGHIYTIIIINVWFRVDLEQKVLWAYRLYGLIQVSRRTGKQ